MRRIKWVGDPSPWSDPALVAGLVRETIPLPLLERFRRFENHQRVCALPGKSVLSLGPESGFTRHYRFGPHNFIVEMDDADAALLFGNEWDRWQFLDVTDMPDTAERPRLTKTQWAALLESFGKLSAGRRRTRGAAS
jgi:hypothetical protein